jgi:class 3 adenylate cyclase/tetratricopeptide (TPR) repeat protein
MRPQELRHVTVVFADLSGSTSLTEEMGNDQARDLMDRVLQRLSTVIARHGGSIERVMGDELMARFGAPVSHEDGPERALRAALDLGTAMSELSAEVGRSLRLHTGINTGLVVAGDLRLDGGSVYSITGVAVNVASRLRSMAGPAQVLVGETTYEATRHLFKFGRGRLVYVRGMSEPVRVYELLGLRAAPERRWARPIQAPLVGRAEQVNSLRHRLTGLVAGRGGVVRLSGEAGIGKSRLLREVRQEARRAGIEWLEGRALRVTQASGLSLFRDVFLRWAGSSSDEVDRAQLLDRLRELIRPLFPGEEQEDIIRFLGDLTGAEVSAAGDGDSLDTNRQRIFLRSRRLFDVMATARSVTLVLEDLHWADVSSLELIEHLLPLTRSARLLLLLVCRPAPEETGQERLKVLWNRAAHTDADLVHLQLTSLTQAGTEEMLTHLLGGSRPSSALAAWLHARAGGNPLFLEESIQVLFSVRALERDSTTGRWNLIADPGSVPIPQSVQGVIMARVDQLADDTRQVLRIISVIGRRCEHRLIARLCDERELDAHLQYLVRAGLLRESAGEAGPSFEFHHLLVQDVVYKSITARARQELHAQIGSGLRALYGDYPESLHELLAFHFAKACDLEAAREHLILAGDQAGRVAADSEAIVYYQEALKLCAPSTEQGADWVLRTRLHLRIGEALFRQGQHNDARKFFEQVLQALRRRLPRSSWGVHLAQALEVLRLVWRRLHGLPSPPPALPDGLETALFRAIEKLSWMDFFLDSQRFFLDVLFMVKEGELLREPAAIVKGATGVGLACNVVGVHRLGDWCHSWAERVARASGVETLRNLAAFGRAFHEFYRLDWDSCLESYRKAAAGALKEGNLRMWGAALARRATLLGWMGRFEESLAGYREIYDYAERAGDRQSATFGIHGMGFVGAFAGDLVEAEGYVRQALELYESIPDYQSIAEARGDLGNILMRQGDLEQAVRELEEAMRIIAKNGLLDAMVAPAPIYLAEALLQLAERSKGDRRARLERALQAVRRALRVSRRVPSVRPAALRLLAKSCWLRGQERRARHLWNQSIEAAQRISAWYELGRTYLDRGRYMEQRDDLLRAEALFGRTGALRERTAALRLSGRLDVRERSFLGPAPDRAPPVRE